MPTTTERRAEQRDRASKFKDERACELYLMYVDLLEVADQLREDRPVRYEREADSIIDLKVSTVRSAAQIMFNRAMDIEYGKR